MSIYTKKERDSKGIAYLADNLFYVVWNINSPFHHVCIAALIYRYSINPTQILSNTGLFSNLLFTIIQILKILSQSGIVPL